MRCLYCDKEMTKYSLSSIFIEDDLLCIECRNRLKINKSYLNIEELKVEYFYDYDGIFKELIIQYKECYDEALYGVFLYMLKDYIKYKYHGYKIFLVPSSVDKLNKRGFNHLQLIFDEVGLDIVDGLRMKCDLIQEGKNLIERKRMVDNYEYVGDILNKVLIVDDIVTTGSSMLGVYKAIKNSSKKVKGLALARKKKTLSL